jgi:3D (Asp-Asp-Asp) domain-containing protein
VSALRAHARRALLDLYALDTRLHSASVRLVALETEQTTLRREETALAMQLASTRHTLTVSRRRLATNLRILYKQGDVSTLAIVLGAQSLDDAVTRLDALTSVADQTRTLIAVATSAGRRVARLRREVHTQTLRIEADVAATRRTTTLLTSARTGKLTLLASLRTQEQLKLQQIQTLQQIAQRVERKSNAIQAAATPAAQSSPAAQTAAAGTSLTVTATGYALGGHTSTGMPVAFGVVAVDPAVIPLGTRLSIPGYGDGVAADTGGGVHGAMIDLWFPTLAQARAWGRRTVTITLH